MSTEKEVHEIASWIGNTPYPPEKKKVKLIKDYENTHLYGYDGTQVANRLVVSTDQLMVSEWTMAPGRQNDPAGLHLYGDECYYIMDGEGVAFNPETGDAMFVSKGDMLYIPQGARHQMFNFSDQQLHVMGAIAPKVWGNDEIGTEIPMVDEPCFFVPDGKEGGKK